MRMNGADIIIAMLKQHNIKTVAGIPGGANLPLYHALHGSGIQHVLARHEQGAGFIAQGMARVSGKAAVCFATSGPGATNLLTAIADARADSIPMVAFTGQVPTAFIGTDAFQEVDTFGMSLPVTKHNYLVRSAEELLHIVPEAFKVAEEGRPGPVLIDVPKDVQKEICEFEQLPPVADKCRAPQLYPQQIEAAAERINTAGRPILYVGGGAMNADAGDLITRVACTAGIPITTTLMGLGIIPANDPLSIGMLGMHGAPYTNMAINRTDLLIACGARFDDRATGRLHDFCPDADIIHIDIDPAELGNIRTAGIAITACIKDALKALLPLIKPNSRDAWLEEIEIIRRRHPQPVPDPEDQHHPVNIIRTIAGRVAPATVVATDVGQHQMWVAQMYPFSYPRTLLTSGGLGTMGFGLPAAIGAALAKPGERVICFSGDGSFLMNIQELAVLADLNLPVTVFLLDNGHLGLVRQQQELFYDEVYSASCFESQPDFASIARNFGVRGMKLGPESDLDRTLTDALESDGPCLVQIPIAHETNVMPIVPPGASNIEMIGV